MRKDFEYRGVYPAVNLPMFEDMSIDEENLRSHLRFLLSQDNLSGLVISGHAGELESLTREERIRVAKIAKEEIGGKCPMICGVTGLSTAEAVQCAVDAKEAGADGLLVMPIPHFAFGASDKPELIVPYFKALADAVDLPMIIFRYKAETGLMYSLNVLLAICEAVPQATALKDASFRYEESWVAFKYFPRKVSVMVAHGGLFLIRFVTADGAVSSFSNVDPEHILKLYDLVKKGKMEEATEVFAKARGISNAIYGRVPSMQHWVVEKEVLKARGLFKTSVCRPPFQPLAPEIVQVIGDAVKASDLPIF